MIALWLWFAQASAVLSLAQFTKVQCQAEQVDVLWLGMEEDLLQGDLVWSGNPCFRQPTLRVTVLRAGKPFQQYSLRPKLNIWVEAWVAPKNLAPKEHFLPEQGRVLLHEQLGSTLIEEQRVWQSKVALTQGQALTTAVVEVPPDASAGTKVTLHVKRNHLLVTAQGLLLEDGHVGQVVKVINQSTNIVQEGWLRSPTLVELP